MNLPKTEKVLEQGFTDAYNAGVEAAMKELRKLAIWGGKDGSHHYTKAMAALRVLKQ